MDDCDDGAGTLSLLRVLRLPGQCPLVEFFLSGTSAMCVHNFALMVRDY